MMLTFPQPIQDPVPILVTGRWTTGDAGIVRELLRFTRTSTGTDPTYAVPWPRPSRRRTRQVGFGLLECRRGVLGGVGCGDLVGGAAAASRPRPGHAM
jgi:hypothetical protein